MVDYDCDVELRIRQIEEKQKKSGQMHEYCYARATLTAIQWTGNNFDEMMKFLAYLGDEDYTKLTIDIGTKEVTILYNGKVTVVPQYSFVILEDGELVELDAKSMEDAMIMVK